MSIGKSRSVPVGDALADYVASYRAVRPAADFVVVNISSPNTKDLRALQAADVARELFATLMAEAKELPLLVKIAPDLSDDAVDAICVEADKAGLAGVVATNTTISREGLVTPSSEIERIGAGGLSGVPLFARAVSVVKRARARLGPDACVVGVGGVNGTDTALTMLRAGADLVQLYTGMIYEGPGIAHAIAKGLAKKLDETRVSTVRELARA
jgi:dihydroorotate dehydrogenase